MNYKKDLIKSYNNNNIYLLNIFIIRGGAHSKFIFGLDKNMEKVKSINIKKVIIHKRI